MAILNRSILTWAPGVVSGVIMLWTVSYAWRRLIVNPDPPLPGRPIIEEIEASHTV